MISGLIALVVGLIGQWLFGLFVAAIVLGDKFSRKRQHVSEAGSHSQSRHSLLSVGVSRSFTELAGLGCVLGVGFTAWCLFLWSFFGGMLGPFPSGLLVAAGFVAGSPLLIARLWHQRAEHSSGSLIRPTERQEQAACRVCQVAISILFITALLQTLQTPQKLWDERAIFALKGIVLFEDRSINSPALLHPDFVQYHPRYPLLLPLAEQNIYALRGVVDDRLSKVNFTLLYVGLVLTTVGVLQRHLSCGRAWLGGLLMATVPVLMPYEYGFLCGQADAPVACFHGLSVLYLWDGLIRQRSGQSGISSLLMAGICGGLAAFTKDEGTAFLMIDASILGLFWLASIRIPDQFRRLSFGLGIFIAAASAILLPWFIHRRSLPLTTEMNYFGRMSVELFVSRLDTLRWSVPHVVGRMFREWREWGLQWWLMLAAMISRPRRSFQKPQLLCVLDVVGSLVALVVAGMLAPAQLDEHIGGSSHRFLMQIAPVAVLFAVTVLFGQDENLQNSRELE